MDKVKVVDAMNRALQMELSSALKYLDFSFRVFGPSRKPIVEHFLQEAKESLDHATMLGEKLVALGAVPVVRADPPNVREGAGIDDLLKMAVENEDAALKTYETILGMVQDETHLRILFENQILEEREHLEELSKMQRR